MFPKSLEGWVDGVSCDEREYATGMREAALLRIDEKSSN
jgi:hypothetical protein